MSNFRTLRAKFETKDDNGIAPKQKFPKSPAFTRKKNPSSEDSEVPKTSKNPSRSTLSAPQSNPPPRAPSPARPPKDMTEQPQEPVRSNSGPPKTNPPRGRPLKSNDVGKPATLPPRTKSPAPTSVPPLPPRTDGLPPRTDIANQPPSRSNNQQNDHLAPSKTVGDPSISDVDDRSEDISEAISDVPDNQSDKEEKGKSSMNARTAKRRTTRKMKKKKPRPEKVPPPSYVPPRKPTYTKRDEVVIKSKTKPAPPLPARTDIQKPPDDDSSHVRARSKSAAGHFRKKNLAPKQDAKVMQRRGSAETEISSPKTGPPPISSAPPPITSAPPPLTSAPPPITSVPPKLPTSPPPGDATISRKSATLPPSFTPIIPKEPAGRTPSLTGEEQLGLDDDQSDYEDDDDIYGQIAADLDDISYDQDFIVVQKDATPAPQQTAKSGFREYWHERKEVVESGILEGDQISKDERARQEAMYEVLTSEQTYKKSLETLEKQFINDNLFTCYLDEFPDGPDSILSNIHEIISVNKRMLEELKSLYDGKVTVDSITDVIKSFVDHQFSSYVTYCANTSDQQYSLSQRRLEDSDFDMFLTGREKALAGQNLQSYLLLPMQRITRMPLLLGAIRKKTDDNSPGKAPLEALYNDVTTIVNKCNEGVRRAETRRHMADLEKKCDFTKIKKHLTSFTDKSDRLIIREELVYILKFKSGKMMGSKINMWLFTDCLVIGLTDPKNESKTMLTEYSPRQLIKISPHFFPPSSYKKKLEPERIFHLQLLSPDKKFIIQCQSANDKTGWLEALRKKEIENEDETIYEEWDVPLVQARHHYEKINDDDLELAEGEICRVLKKYTDGWCFGQRESDGQQGWFPMSFMIEIDSDHARYREMIKKQQLLDIVANDEKAAAFFSTMKKD